MHLTNYSLNKRAEGFVHSAGGGDADETGGNSGGGTEDSGTKRTLSSLWRRLEVELGPERADGVRAQVDEIIVRTLIASEASLNDTAERHLPAAGRATPLPVRSGFQLFGFDVMLDEAAKPWLLEVNADPSIHTDSPLDLRVKGSMLVDALNVVGLPVTSPQVPGEVAAEQYRQRSSSWMAAAPAAAPAPAAAAAVEGRRWSKAGAGSGGSSAPPPLTAELDAWVAAAAPSRPELESMSEAERIEQWTMHLVNAEFVRSRASRWRRLLPSKRSDEYRPLFEEECTGRTLHHLPFEV